MSNVVAHTHRFGDYLAHYDKEHNKCVIKKIHWNVPMSDTFMEVADDFWYMNADTMVLKIESTEYFKQLNNKGEAVV